MNTTMSRLGAQLAKDRATINGLAEASQAVGAEPNSEALVYVDELKALHATAQSTFDRCRAAGDSLSMGLQAELKIAADDLRAALAELML